MSLEIRGSAPLFEVYDMPASIAFYCDVLGFEVVSTNRGGGRSDADGSRIRWDPATIDWAWLRLNDVDLMLNTAYEKGERPPVRDRHRVFGHGVCFYIGCPDVDAAHDHLRAHGVDVKPPKVAHYGMKQLYVRDPDGYNLCFQWTTE